MTKQNVTRITVSSLVGLSSAFTLISLIAGFDFSRVSPENPHSTLVWLLAVVSGVFAALLAWSLLSLPNQVDIVDGERHAEVQCPDCGGMMYEDWRLCPHCGARIQDESTPSPGTAASR